LAACASRAENVLTPFPGGPTVARADGAHQVDMLVATTRKPLPQEPGQMFSGERAQVVNFAEVAISIPPDSAREVGEVQWPSRLPGDPAREFVTL
ncbi:hypothetical protein, partial [Salmonella sp. S071_01786]|uniref:hypothetical protein n=1 Tax=Salmonella sp. S071_01786 TaxID=2665571 RepID=UPI001CA82DBC